MALSLVETIVPILLTVMFGIQAIQDCFGKSIADSAERDHLLREMVSLMF